LRIFLIYRAFRAASAAARRALHAGIETKNFEQIRLVRRRQCSSGLQAVADVAAAIKAGFYTIGIGAGVETMSKNPMAWEGGVNPRIAESKDAQNCLVPMGAFTAALVVTTGSYCSPCTAPSENMCPPKSSMPPNVVRMLADCSDYSGRLLTSKFICRLHWPWLLFSTCSCLDLSTRWIHLTP
jgi:hypothetical protein